MDTFFEDISANNVPTPPTQTTGPQPSQTTGPNNEFEELLSRSTTSAFRLHENSKNYGKKFLTKDGCYGHSFPNGKRASLMDINDFPLEVVCLGGVGKAIRMAPLNDKTKDTGKARQNWNFESSKGVVRLFLGSTTILAKSIAAPIIEFCLFFKQLCARNFGLPARDMSEAKKQSISILIELEQIFPPAFFDIMIHVAIHLPDEAILGGPIRYRWMFPFERYMKKLKNYVRNKAKPEGSIAEGYVAEEALTFCSRYLKDDVETRFNRLGRNDDGEFRKNNIHSCEPKISTQVFYLEDLARQPRGWKVVEHVYHRDMAESDQDVIHGSSSSNVTLSVELTNFEHTDLSINSESTEVDASPVNDDNANANEGNAEDDVYAHMACVFPRSHGGDAGGSPPRRPNRPVPAQCESSNLRIETGNASLRRAFRQNGQRPLTIGFDYGDLGTFHPTGDYSSMLNSLMGETVKYLPLACEWEEIPEAYKAHIFPTLESYFDLASWYNNQDKVVMGNNVYTVGDRVKLGLQLKLRILWRKNKQRIKADHFTRYGSAEEARNHLPPKKVWGDRTEDEWNNLVDWWSHPDRVARSLQNAANRAKNTILTHQGKKSFAQGRNEYKVQKGHYEDLIETWRKTHSRPETGEFKTEKNRKRYLDMKSMQDQVRAGVIPYKTDQDILDEVARSSGISRCQMLYVGRDWEPDIEAKRSNEAELLRKQTAEAQQRAYLAALKADAAYQNSETMYGHSQLPRFITNPHNNDTRSVDELARDRELAGEDNDVGDNNEEGDNQQSGGDYSEDEEGDNEEVQNESEESD
ncbi:acidic leucine-rich nuclear phosphoprotein 32 family member A [Tanacetum coccineum]|uniref:Acidic leucine-rich nuclear phosphoprotein 32 family member A n=1 Tax=Tanacetum coccineum TaxID=301880 RepID=A0ABQ5D1Q0_9ASTR